MYKHSPYNNGASDSNNELYDGLEEEDGDSSFEQNMIREMNQQRIDNTRSARPQAFRKARPRGKGSLTMANLQRITPVQAPDPARVQYESPGSASSGASERQLNYPREWGTKGKRSSSWLRRITMDSAEQRQRANMGEDVDWLQAAADEPLPSVEDSPLSHRGSARGTPASTYKRNDSLERILKSELSDDFTGRDLIASTPAVVSRNTALDEIWRRELEIPLDEGLEEIEVDESVYLTSQPEHHQSLSGGQSSRSGPANRVSVTQTKQQYTSGLSQTWTHPAEQDIQLPKRTQRSITPVGASANRGNRVPSSPIAPKSPHSVGAVDREVIPQVQKSPRRPGHHREDSQDILKRLSRASGTPSPARDMNSGNAASSKQTGSSQQTTSDAGVSRQRSTDALKRQSKELAQNIARRSEAKRDDAQQELQQQRGTSTLSNRRAVEPQSKNSTAQGLGPKTPTVTGAWIETPKTGTVRQPAEYGRTSSLKKDTVAGPSKSGPSPAEQPASKPPTEPSLPSSALAAVVDEARENFNQNEGEGLGEATIQSLEDLMSPTGEHSMLEEDTLDNLELPSTKPTTAAGKAREQEIRQLKNMSDHLRSTQRGLRDVRHGMTRVENQVAETKEPTTSTSASSRGIGSHNCDRPLSVVWRQTKSFFYTHDNGKRRLTWPSIFGLVFLAWLATEFSLWYVLSTPSIPTPTKTIHFSGLYCQTTYATGMEGYGIGHEAPRMPFVTPTMLFRPFQFIWTPLWLTVSTFLHWLWGLVFFLFEADENAVTATSTTAIGQSIVETATIRATEWLEGDWSMDHDEILS